MQLKSAPLWSTPLSRGLPAPPSYLRLLDKVQARSQRLIRLKALQDQLLPPLQPLQQRRDVAGLCVVYKTHKQHVPHLAALRQPWARPHGHTTRTAATRDHQLIVPFARTETSLRSFLPRYTRMWNRMVQQTQLHSTSSLQTFKILQPLNGGRGQRGKMIHDQKASVIFGTPKTLQKAQKRTTMTCSPTAQPNRTHKEQGEFRAPSTCTPHTLRSKKGLVLGPAECGSFCVL
ncbi:hypothetical protein GWK47_035993 [Chionoecetes opilio]|uniref:Uncharacterized protein n=1 Tax=Chionoecetes opilio TaxID=41210 RepID=A0A8J4YTI1_CHIOP|nr:hypothetical protein GWK47_035993 [Chionoecetes opilio]